MRTSVVMYTQMAVDIDNVHGFFIFNTTEENAHVDESLGKLSALFYPNTRG